MPTPARWALIVLAAIGALAAPGGAVVTVPQLQPIGTFSSPIHVAAPLHEDHLLFVVERAGRIRVVRDGVLRSQPFLDIGNREQAEVTALYPLSSISSGCLSVPG